MHVHASHGGSEKTSRVLRFSLVVTAAYIVLLVVAGIRAHSLALLSEAGHNLSDFFALLLSLTAVYLQSRPPSSTKTYGYHRAGVLAALVNAVSLVAVSGFIFYEAFRRLQNPEQVHAGVMIWVAAAGVVMNGVIALLLYRAGQRRQHPQRAAARNRRHAFDRRGHRRRLGHHGHRASTGSIRCFRSPSACSFCGRDSASCARRSTFCSKARRAE